MDYAINEIKTIINEQLSILDEVADSVEIEYDKDDVLDGVYNAFDGILSLLDDVGTENDFCPDMAKEMACKSRLMEFKYDFSNKEVFAPEDIVYDQLEYSDIKYLERCGYHFHGLAEKDD